MGYMAKSKFKISFKKRKMKRYFHTGAKLMLSWILFEKLVQKK